LLKFSVVENKKQTFGQKIIFLTRLCQFAAYYVRFSKLF